LLGSQRRRGKIVRKAALRLDKESATGRDSNIPAQSMHSTKSREHWLVDPIPIPDIKSQMESNIPPMSQMETIEPVIMALTAPAAPN
jgi:hypothetical protein